MNSGHAVLLFLNILIVCIAAVLGAISAMHNVWHLAAICGGLVLANAALGLINFWMMAHDRP